MSRILALDFCTTAASVNELRREQVSETFDAVVRLGALVQMQRFAEEEKQAATVKENQRLAAQRLRTAGGQQRTVRFSPALLKSLQAPAPPPVAPSCAKAAFTETWTFDHAIKSVGAKKAGYCGVGSSGNGIVWKVLANHGGHPRLLAVKIPLHADFPLESELFMLHICTGMRHIVQIAPFFPPAEHGKMRPGAWETGGTLLGLVMLPVDSIPFDKLNNCQGWCIFHALQCAMCLLDGCAGLHSRGLVHGDIKPPNVLISPKNWRATIVDLGHVQNVGGEPEMYGTQGFRAPETRQKVFEQRKTGGEDLPLVEGWACGVTILCLLKGVETLWTEGELRGRRRRVFGTEHDWQDYDLERIADAAKEMGEGGEGDRWREGIGLLAVLPAVEEDQCELWRWIGTMLRPNVSGERPRCSPKEAAAALRRLRVRGTLPSE
jgi:hypothetical protein